MIGQERKKENRNCFRFERIVKRIRRYSHISSMVSLRQWSGTELRAWHLQRFPETRRISLLLWISSETFSRPIHSLPFSLHTHTHSAMFLFSPTRGLYFEFYKEKTTRDTIRNESDRYVSIFFISKKKSLKIRIQGGTKIEIWLNTRYCCFFPQKISWIKCVENYEYEYLKDYYFSTFRYYSSSIKSFFFFGNKLFISFNLRIFHIYFFFINSNRFWIDILEWTITDEISVY